MSDVKNYKAGQSLWQESWKRLKKNKASMLSMWVIIFVCLIGLLANFVAPHSFDTQDMESILVSPNSTYLLGTDSLGRDLLSRLIYGARISMAVAIFTAILSLIMGGLYGAVSGWIGGRTDSVMMRIIDTLYSIPTLVLLIIVKVLFDAIDIIENPELRALTSILLALSVTGWVTLARIVRGQVIQLKSLLYVEAAQSMGASSPSILVKHIFPNILGPIVILLTMQIPGNILYESFLSYLGLGLQPPYSSWGVLASDGWRSLRTFPHLMIAPGVIMFITLLAFNFLGDGLRDAFDPKLRGKK